MEIDRKMLEKAAQLPDDQLAALIYAVVSAAGGSQKQAKAAIANADKLKKKLHAASDRELQELIAGLDPQVLEKIAGTLKKGGLSGG